MKIPNVPSEKIVDKNGNMTEQWSSFMRNLATQLRIHVSDDGYLFPWLDTDSINKLNTNDNIGRIIYNSTTQTMMVNNTGTFVNIATL